MTRHLRRLVAATLLAAVAAGCGAEEQGGLEGASPGPDAVVGGEVTQIELFYDDIVIAADGSVTGPDGAELVTEFRVDTEISVVAEFDEALSDPGDYSVRHVVEAVDGDRVEDSYTFTFDPSAPPAQVVFPEEEDAGTPWLVWTIALAGVAVIAVLGWRLLRSMAELRSTSRPRRPS